MISNLSNFKNPELDLSDAYKEQCALICIKTLKTFFAEHDKIDSIGMNEQNKEEYKALMIQARSVFPDQFENMGIGIDLAL